jgi:putative FmdB family regulatory protein
MWRNSLMPTYEYKCDACDHSFDEFQSIKAEPLKKCPMCGKSKLRRLIGGGAAVLFKGSGFYQTDYRSDSYKQSAKKDEQSTAPAASTDKTNSNGTATPAKESGQAGGGNRNKAGKSSKSES